MLRKEKRLIMRFRTKGNQGFFGLKRFVYNDGLKSSIFLNIKELF
ncbi:ABC transporter substrate-binding protein [Listeria monocytogenes]|nr:hypothetical protein LMIV_1843 [Listeria monocytogenes FSL J1-208]PCW75737.1 ABC transporter substrate-binding protein [Listeria monocytogenes]PCX93393.1 ABC transporter substrate-binding protein [Listeria monocytogenes]PCX96470.1 ABC transporter substrate-binding protein [Listeria monocytogenes]RFQ30488.1 ABC transporter substrate-binding protein [Listeria monocytogenes]